MGRGTFSKRWKTKFSCCFCCKADARYFLPTILLSRLNVHLSVLTQNVFFICNVTSKSSEPGFVVGAGIIANCLGKFLVENNIPRRHFGQYRDYAYAFVTPGLHTYFSDINIRKWKRFLFLMLMLMLMSLPVYTAYRVYTCVHACAYAYVAVKTRL